MSDEDVKRRDCKDEDEDGVDPDKSIAICKFVIAEKIRILSA